MSNGRFAVVVGGSTTLQVYWLARRHRCEALLTAAVEGHWITHIRATLTIAGMRNPRAGYAYTAQAGYGIGREGSGQITSEVYDKVLDH
jgi:hypothetical protein